MSTSRRFSLGLALAAVLLGPGAAVAQEQEPLFFFPLTPCRAIDTRIVSQGPALTHNGRRNFLIKGACGVAFNAEAVVVTATVASVSGPGNIRLFPANLASPPNVSTLNFSGNDAEVANGAIVRLGPGDPDLSVFAVVPGGSGQVHLILDVTGYFVPGT